MKRLSSFLFASICTLSVVLTGCKTAQKPPFKKIRNVSVILPYAPEGKYLFVQNDTVYFCSYNYNTYKQADIYDTYYGKKLHIVNLKGLFLPYGVSFVKVKNLDSIYVLGTDNNVLYLINTKNNILRKIHMDSLVKKQISFNYPIRVWEAPYYKILHNRNIILHIANDKPIKESNNVYESQIQYNKNYISLPNFAYISNFLDSNFKVLCETPPIMSKFMKENEYFPMAISYFFHKDTVYFYAGFHNKLIRYHEKNLQYIDEIKVHSKYTKLEYPVPVITEKNIHKVFQTTIPLISRLGFIMNIGFNHKKQCFYLHISHSHPEYREQKEYTTPANIDERKSSILVYDRNWKKVSEYMLPDTEKDVHFLENGNFITYTKSKNPRNITLNFYQWTE